MERSIRIGKDFNVRWSIHRVVDGERQPYELAGKELVLQYRTPYGLKEATEWKVVGNTIVWTFRGKEQKALGSYELILTENGGKDGMVTVDTCRAFKLVAHSCEETEGSGSDIVIEDVVLESEVAFAPIVIEGGGGSYDDTKIKEDIADLQAKDKATDAQLAEQSAKLTELSKSKQDNIVDLDSIRSGASKGSTSEQTINKTTSLSPDSTDTQYPSAKAVFTAISNVERGKQGVISQTQTWTQAADKGYDYTIKDVVRGFIPQYAIDLYTSAGAEFNETSGYFEINEIKDISYKEMVMIYNRTLPFSLGLFSPSGVTLGGGYMLTDPQFRTSLPVQPYRYYMMTQADFSFLMWNNWFIESLSFFEGIDIYTKNITSMCDTCWRLKRINGTIECKNASTTYTSAFNNCFSLEEVRLKSVKGNLSFSHSARLSIASILFAIKNEIASSAITITLHADAYARAMADAEITAALAAHPNVSLAKA